MRGSGAFRTSIVPGGALAGPWVANSLWKNARAVPSLDLRFAENKSLTDAKTGASLVTFTRASTGTFVGSDGLIKTATTNEARFGHNPTTGESLGLLVEEARTNLLLRSEAIATSPWFAGSNTTLTNNTGEVLDPAGGSTATKVLVSGGTGSFGQGATLTAAIHTGSIWLRCSTGTISASLIVYLGASPFTNIGTTNVTITTSWQRFTVVTSTATAVAYNLQLNNIAVGTVYAWGAQLEAGAFPTSYIPTTSATATRAADVASITGTNFSSWYNQTEGTVHAAWQFNAGAVSTSRHVCNFNDSVVDQFIGVFASGVNTLSTNSFVAGTSQGRLDIAGSPAALLPYKSATAYGAGNRAFTLNGVPPVSGTGSLPSATRLEIGYSFGSNFLNGTIKRLTYWPTRLPNPTLQAITTP